MMANHGGSRPGSGAKKQFAQPDTLIKVRASKEEMAILKSQTTPRQRVEILMSVLAPAPEPAETVIVTRHKGAVEWLAERGIEGEVLEQVTVEDVAGKRVIGNLPFELAAEAAKVTVISFIDLPLDQRGKDITPAQMDEYGAHLADFKVTPA